MHNSAKEFVWSIRIFGIPSRRHRDVGRGMRAAQPIIQSVGSILLLDKQLILCSKAPAFAGALEYFFYQSTDGKG